MKNGKKFSGERDCGKGRMRQWDECRMVGGGGGLGVTSSGGRVHLTVLIGAFVRYRTRIDGFAGSELEGHEPAGR